MTSIDELADARARGADDAEAFATWMRARGPRVFDPVDVERLRGLTVGEMRMRGVDARDAAGGRDAWREDSNGASDSRDLGERWETGEDGGGGARVRSRAGELGRWGRGR